MIGISSHHNKRMRLNDAVTFQMSRTDPKPSLLVMDHNFQCSIAIFYLYLIYCVKNSIVIQFPWDIYMHPVLYSIKPWSKLNWSWPYGFSLTKQDETHVFFFIILSYPKSYLFSPHYLTDPFSLFLPMLFFSLPLLNLSTRIKSLFSTSVLVRLHCTC